MPAEFEIDVIVDPSGARRGGRAVRRELNQVQRDADALRRTLVRTFAVLTTGAVLTGLIRLLAEFSQSMSTVQAVTQATETQFKSLREEALRLGATTRFSATEAGDAMLFLARAGFEADEVLKGVGSTLLLAQAGALDLGTAADIASNVLQGFRLEVEDLNEVVDVLALTANSSNTNIQQLGTAMQFVAPVAAGLGVSVQEASAAVGALSDAGLQASLAGTGLRRVLSELESPSSASIKLLRSLGVATDEVSISNVGLTGALQRLRDAGITTGQALELFGDRGGPAFEVLQNAIPDVIEMTEALQAADGTAQRIAETMDMNLNGALLALRSSLQNVILQFGELGGQSVITQFVQVLTELMRDLADSIETVGRVAAVVGTILAVQLARRGILVVVAAVDTLTLAIAANPIGALLVLVVAATAALVAFADQIGIGSDNLATLQDFAIATFNFMERGFNEILVVVQNVFGFIGFLAGETANLISFVFGGAFGMVETGASELFGEVELSITSVLAAVALVSDSFVGIFLGAFNAIVAIYDNLRPALGEKFIDAINFVKRIVQDGINEIIEGINEALDFAGIARIDPVQFTVAEQEFRGAGENLGLAIEEGLLSGFEFDAARQALSGIVDEANSFAQARIDAAESSSASGSTGGGAGGGAGGTDIASATGTLARQGAAAAASSLPPSFQSLIDELRVEADLLKLTDNEREIATGLIDIETQSKMRLTGAQREEATSLIENIQALRDQAEVFDFIKGPQEDYMATLAAVNQLLEDQKISLQERDQILASTALGSAVNDIQTSLLSPEDAETERLQNSLAERQLIIEQAVEARVLTEQEGALIIQDLNQQTQDMILNAEKERAALQLGAASDTFNTLGQITSKFAGEQSTAAKTLFGISKAFAIAEATVKISQGVANALSLGFPAGIVAAAAVAAQAAGLIQTIQGAQFEGGFQNGGEFMVGGSGGTDSQNVSFQATPGERVTVETPQQQASGDGAAPQSGQTEGGGVRIINVVDPAMVEGFLTSAEGEKTLLNVIERNSGSINATLQG